MEPITIETAKEIYNAAKKIQQVYNVSKQMKNVAESEGADQLVATKDLVSSASKIQQSSKEGQEKGKDDLHNNSFNIDNNAHHTVEEIDKPELFVESFPVHNSSHADVCSKNLFVDEFPIDNLKDNHELSNLATATDNNSEVSISNLALSGQIESKVNQEKLSHHITDDVAKGGINNITSEYLSSESKEIGDISTNLDEPKSFEEYSEVRKSGGSYRDIKAEGWGWNDKQQHEVHHMPADSAYDMGEGKSPYLERDDGPAIAMDYEDHRKTASCGSSREAREYQQIQNDLVKNGKFKEALQMDIDDIHDKFGSKYDKAISEALEYVKGLESNGKI